MTEETIDAGSTQYLVEGDWFVIRGGGSTIQARCVDSEATVWQVDGRDVEAEAALALIKARTSNQETAAFQGIAAACEAAYRSGNRRGAAAGWRIGAALGDPASTHYFGLCLRDGELGRVESKAAFRYFQKGAELGEPRSLRELARCFRAGFGVKRNDEKFYETLRRMAENGDLLPLSDEIPKVYRDDPFKTRWVELAKEWIEIARRRLQSASNQGAEQESATATEEKVKDALIEWAYTLGQLYSDDSPALGLKRDDAESRKYFEIAAEYDDPAALYEAGILALNGIGGAVDTKLAERRLFRSATLNDWDAMEEYGYLAARSDDPDTVAEGVRWLRLAMQSSHFSDQDEIVPFLQALGQEIDLTAIQGYPQGWSADVKPRRPPYNFTFERRRDESSSCRDLVRLFIAAGIFWILYLLVAFITNNLSR